MIVQPNYQECNNVKPLIVVNSKVHLDQRPDGVLQVSTKNGIGTVFTSSRVQLVNGFHRHGDRCTPALFNGWSPEYFYPHPESIHFEIGLQPDKQHHRLGTQKL